MKNPNPNNTSSAKPNPTTSSNSNNSPVKPRSPDPNLTKAVRQYKDASNFFCGSWGVKSAKDQLEQVYNSYAEEKDDKEQKRLRADWIDKIKGSLAENSKLSAKKRIAAYELLEDHDNDSEKVKLYTSLGSQLKQAKNRKIGTTITLVSATAVVWVDKLVFILSGDELSTTTQIVSVCTASAITVVNIALCFFGFGPLAQGVGSELTVDRSRKEDVGEEAQVIGGIQLTAKKDVASDALSPLLNRPAEKPLNADELVMISNTKDTVTIKDNRDITVGKKATVNNQINIEVTGNITSC